MSWPTVCGKTQKEWNSFFNCTYLDRCWPMDKLPEIVAENARYTFPSFRCRATKTYQHRSPLPSAAASVAVHYYWRLFACLRLLWWIEGSRCRTRRFQASHQLRKLMTDWSENFWHLTVEAFQNSHTTNKTDKNKKTNSAEHAFTNTLTHSVAALFCRWAHTSLKGKKVTQQVGENRSRNFLHCEHCFSYDKRFQNFGS